MDERDINRTLRNLKLVVWLQHMFILLVAVVIFGVPAAMTTPLNTESYTDTVKY